MMQTDLWTAFTATADRNQHKAAFLVGDQCWTFAQWQTLAERFRAAYRGRGVGRGDRILVWTSNRVEVAAAVAAAWGEAAIPAIMDAACRAPQLHSALATVAPRLIVRAGESALPGLTADVTVLVADEVHDAPLESRRPAVSSLPTDPASIVFTSGSTGNPKGVVQSHGSLMRGCAAVASYLGLRDDDILLCPVPWSFDYGYGQLLSTALLGNTQVIPTAFNPFGICAAMTRHQPTVLAGVPSLFTYLMGGMSPIRETDRSSVRLITNTGGQIPAPVLRSLSDAFPASRIVLNYGLTETYRSCYIPEGTTSRPGLIGRSIPGADVVVLREDGSVADVGEEGEIVHRGDYVCLGYWNDPEATSRTIRADPLSGPGNPFAGRAVFTGDYGYRDIDGLIVYRGRRDHLLKSMGIRTSPGEIEHLLYESGLVDVAAVFGRPHDLLGHEVWAAVALKEDTAEHRADLARYARSVMTPAMLPRRYLFRDPMPRTATGKIDYPALHLEADADA